MKGSIDQILVFFFKKKLTPTEMDLLITVTVDMTAYEDRDGYHVRSSAGIFCVLHRRSV